jgi:hypothetical protein
MGSNSKVQVVASESTKKAESQKSKVSKKSEEPKEEEEEEVVSKVEETTTETTPFDEQLKSVQKVYSETKKQMQELHSCIKKMQAVHKSELKKARTKKSRRSDKKNPTGFARLRPVPAKMAEFIGVPSGTELSGPEITKKVWAVLKQRDLTFSDEEAKKKGLAKGDQRVLRVDKVVSKLFHIDESVNASINSDDYDGFNFGNLQFYIKQGLEGKKLPRISREEYNKKRADKAAAKAAAKAALKPVKIEAKAPKAEAKAPKAESKPAKASKVEAKSEHEPKESKKLKSAKTLTK